MRLAKFRLAIVAGLIIVGASGCGTFMAHRMAQAPNSYPTWFAPSAPVELDFNVQVLTNIPARYIKVGPPEAKLRYRVLDPADYHLKVAVTNWMAHGKEKFDFKFKYDYPAPTNQWTVAPRGTIFLLHGYGLSQFAMAPWAMRLAENGWRCVLVDLRGHGKSTGRTIYYGVEETYDMSKLLDQLTRDGLVHGPVAAMGESYGAALALRWKGLDPRVEKVVAIAPYAKLSNAVMNINHDYAGWVPAWLVRAGVKRLPAVLEVQPGELNMDAVLEQHPVPALFIAGANDTIAPPGEVRKLYDLATHGSEWLEVQRATHESLTYFFSDLAQPVIDWLDASGYPASTTASASSSLLQSSSGSSNPTESRMR